MSDKPDTLKPYKVKNIITNVSDIFDGNEDHLDDYLYPDDTNTTILNKIACYYYSVDEPITPNEIYAYHSNNKSLCFKYENR